jgi:polyhydroxyalkanoate synthesis regulator protein
MLAAVTAHNGRPMVPASDPVTIKLYAQRRFYQPRSGSYVTYDDLLALACGGARIVVEDAHTGADLTALVLSSNQTEH